MLMALKWIINFWLAGVPYLLYCIVSLAYNIFVNIAWNDWWAEGNIFLLANTLYLVV